MRIKVVLYVLSIFLLVTALTSCSRKENTETIQVVSKHKENDSIAPKSALITPTAEPLHTQAQPTVKDVLNQKKEHQKIAVDSGSTKVSIDKSGPVKTPDVKKDTKESSVSKKSISNKAATNPSHGRKAVNKTASKEETDPVQKYIGLIIDKDCLNDPGPEKDTLDCLLMDSCRESGYGLAVKVDGDYQWYAFDSQGQKIAWELLKSTRQYQQISVTVEGTLTKNLLKVINMYENPVE